MIIDTTTFRLRTGIDEQTFRTADERVQQEVVYRQPGIVRRTTARGADGRWIVITLWATAADADAAATALETAEQAAALSAIVDHDSVATARWETLD